MLRIDDPLIALILRFVLSEDELQQPDEEFVQQQIRTLRDYVAQFPEEEQEKHALLWIEQHSKAYRRNWEKQTAPCYATKAQCADCPMMLEGDASLCVIHYKWLKLLKAYCDDSISTKAYIEKSLALLQKHKRHLKRQYDAK